MRRSALAFVILCLLCESGNAQSQITGARDYALSGSSVLWAPWSASIFLNPAEAARLHQTELLVGTDRISTISSLTANYFLPSFGTLAGGIANDPNETYYNVSYGLIFGSYHTIGAGFTFLKNEPEWSGLSFGTAFHFPTRNSPYSGLHLGMSALNFSGESESTRFALNFGVAYWVAPEVGRLQISYKDQADHPGVRVGFETRATDWLSILAGARSFKTFTGGVGVQFGAGAIDLAYGRDGLSLAVNVIVGETSQESRTLYFEQGLDAFDERRYFDAHQSFSRAVDYDEYFFEARRMAEYSLTALDSTIATALSRGKSLERQRRLLEAAATYSELLKIEPRNREARQGLTRVQANLHSYVSTQLRRGDSLKTRGEYDKARESFERVLTVDPENSTASAGLKSMERTVKDEVQERLARARRYLSRDRLDQAEAEYRRVLRADRRNLEAQRGLSRIQERRVEEDFNAAKSTFETGDYYGALQLFQDVLGRSPDHAGTKQYITQIRQILQPDLDVHFREGLQLYLNERYTEAIREWDKGLLIDPENVLILDYYRRAQEKVKALEKLK